MMADLAGTCVFALEAFTALGAHLDLFLAQVPVILRVDVYATAALVGAVVLGLMMRRARSCILQPRTPESFRDLK